MIASHGLDPLDGLRVGLRALCTYAVMMDAWLLKVSLQVSINFIQQKTQ